MKEVDEVLKGIRNLTLFALFLGALGVFILMLKNNIIRFPESQEVVVEKALGEEIFPGEIGSIDPESGLIIDHGLNVVKTQCGACHSTQLVAQNRFSREGWLDLIRWMQEKQNLWDLGDQEEVILDYLEKNCAPKKSGRRRNLENVQWYELD